MVLNLDCEEPAPEGVNVSERETVTAKQRVYRERLCVEGHLAHAANRRDKMRRHRIPPRQRGLKTSYSWAKGTAASERSSSPTAAGDGGGAQAWWSNSEQSRDRKAQAAVRCSRLAGSR